MRKPLYAGLAVALLATGLATAGQATARPIAPIPCHLRNQLGRRRLELLPAGSERQLDFSTAWSGQGAGSAGHQGRPVVRHHTGEDEPSADARRSESLERPPAGDHDDPGGTEAGEPPAAGCPGHQQSPPSPWLKGKHHEKHPLRGGSSSRARVRTVHTRSRHSDGETGLRSGASRAGVREPRQSHQAGHGPDNRRSGELLVGRQHPVQLPAGGNVVPPGLPSD